MYIHNDSHDEKTPIDQKIELLQDFCILSRRAKKQEEMVRSILATCTSDVQMEQKLYHLLRGSETLQEFISRHYAPSLRQLKAIKR